MFTHDNEDLVKIDCLGEACPIPIIKIQKKLDQIKNGETFMLVTDHSCTLSSVSDFCKKHKLNCNPTEVINGVWEIVVSK